MEELLPTGPYMDEFMEGISEGMTAFDLGSNLWSTAASVFMYVFMAIGMYAIAKRRGIKHPWLAWIPFGSTWLLGCISDQFRYVARGQEKSKRKVMLGFEIAVAAIGTVAIILLVVAVVSVFGMLGSEQLTPDSAYMAKVMSPLMIALILCIVMLGLTIALTVLTYMALYDLFRSCDPEKATMFLVLSIVLSLVGVGGILQAIFVFAVRRKDLGMPPRQDQVVYAQPVFQPPVDPWQQNNNF